LTAYSPLGSNVNSSLVKEGSEVPSVLLLDETLGKIAKNESQTPAQVLLAWGVQRGFSVIPKSVHEDRLKQNLNAKEISIQSLADVDALNRNHRYIDPLKFWKIDIFA
jgi:diketogulonate reductase-like aldo/keto reductase